MTHLSALFDVRRRSFARRLSEAGPTGLVIGILVLAGVATGGWALTPTLSDGETALNTAFWLTAATASITSFHCMDLMFRVDAVRALDHLPISLGSLFWDRALAVIMDALLYAVPVATLFVPMGVMMRDPAALGAAAMGCVGLPAAGLASFVIYLYIGIRASGGRLTNDEGKDAGMDADMYGGPGGVLLYAPGIALSAAVIALVGVRLAIRESIRPDAPAGVMTTVWLVGVVGVITLAAYGYYALTHNYIPIRARFREADSMSFDVDLDYQDSIFETSVRGERWAAPVARPLVRALALQYQRRHLLARYVFPASGFAAALALIRLEPDVFPVWAAAAVPAVLLGSFSNPWRRLQAREFHPNILDSLPMRDEDRATASTIQAIREVTYAAISYLLFTVPTVALTSTLSDAGILAFGVLGAAGLVAAMSTPATRLSASAARWAPPVGAVAATAALYLSPLTVTVFGLSVIVWIAVTAFRYPDDEQHE